jgi:hypothetical protein
LFHGALILSAGIRLQRQHFPPCYQELHDSGFHSLSILAALNLKTIRFRHNAAADCFDVALQGGDFTNFDGTGGKR